MKHENALRIANALPQSARVVDVGGGASAFPRADYVIDALPFEARNALGAPDGIGTPRYTPDTWCQVDLCDHTPWPFPDKFFDYAVCSHLLEDVRDPIWICRELTRVARAGYIEVPSRVVEQSLGVEHPRFAGYFHHRWLVSRVENGLEFRMKPHLLHSLRDGIVARVGPARRINPEYECLTFEWEGAFSAREVLEFDEPTLAAELCAFAAQARTQPGLVVSARRSPPDLLRMHVYYERLRWIGR